MEVYKYLPKSDLTIKAVRYNELFFACIDELNDPYDTKIPFDLKGNVDVWERVISTFCSYGDIKKIGNNINPNIVAEYLSKNLTCYSEVNDKLKAPDFHIAVFNAFKKRTINIAWDIDYFIDYLIIHFHKWLGGRVYIISFSKVIADPIMWSHYASNHTGISLGFQLEDNKIKSEKNIRSQISDEYELKEVKYKCELKPINGFYMLPGAFNVKMIPNEERNKSWSELNECYHTKYQSWSYERELRASHYNWMTSSCTVDGEMKMNSIDRIFYYKQSMLKSVCFGSKILNSFKETIKQSVLQNRIVYANNKDILLPPLEFYQMYSQPTNFLMSKKFEGGIGCFNELVDVNGWQEQMQKYKVLEKHYKNIENKPTS